MKILVIICILFSVTKILAIPPDPLPSDHAWVDGTIVFRQGYTPTSNEINVSTNCLIFKNYQEFLDATTKASGMLKKIKELRAEISNNSDSPAIQVLLARRIVWLISYQTTLP